ncbi:MAG: hypothetical protein RR307_05425, partial [Clostridia bacterium]
KLTNDIDLKDVVINPIGYLKSDKTKVFKKINLDGASFSLRNINKVNHTNTGKYSALMGLDDGSVIKNTNFYFTSSGAFGALGIAYITNGTVAFNNVNTYGYINTVGGSASTVGVFAAQPYYKWNDTPTTPTIKFTGCNNYTNVLGATATTVGGFIGDGSNSIISFENCINFGNMKGAIGTAGGFIGYVTEGNYTVKNCENKGEITQLQPNTKNEEGAITKWFAGKFAGNATDPAAEFKANGSIKTITPMTSTPTSFTAATTSFTFTKIANATKYVVQYTFGTNTKSVERFQVEYKQPTGTATDVTATYYNTINAYTAADAQPDASYIKTSDPKYFVNGNTAYLYLSSIGVTSITPSKVFVFAYDANGTLIGFRMLGNWVTNAVAYTPEKTNP